jgi:hypothetical protein
VWEFMGGPTAALLKEGEAFGYRFAEALKE